MRHLKYGVDVRKWKMEVKYKIRSETEVRVKLSYKLCAIMYVQ